MVTTTMTKEQARVKMKKVCGNCTASTINVYTRNLFRLAKLAGFEGIPKTAKWLASKSLLAKFAKQPLNARRLLSVAGVKGMSMYGQETSGEWGPLMSKATEQYEKEILNYVLYSPQWGPLNCVKKHTC